LQRQVTTEEGKEMARGYGAPFMETSAKNRVNVEEAFYQLVREIRKINSTQSSKKKGKSGKKCAIL
jgi:GTPase KRas